MEIPRYFRTKNPIVVLAFLLLCIILCFLPTGFEPHRAEDSYLVKAIVVGVDNSDLRQSLVVHTGTQNVQVEILEGPHRGKTARVANSLSGKLEFDEIYQEGDTILVEYKLDEGRVHMAFTRGYYRLTHEFILIVVFCIFIIAVAGFTGFKALISFIFAALMMWKVLIPLFLKDVSPIPIALIVIAALTASVSFLVGGWTRRGWTAFSGAFSGIALACLLAVLFAPGFKINGAVRPFAENLIYAGYPHLNLADIFLAGIFLACSGAVMDLSMDIAASMDEVKSKKPDITFRELFSSGMSVGRSVVGTMTTTLLLAYSGGYTAMLMNFMSQGLELRHIFNLNFVASEILNVIVGSFGLVAVAPLTAAIGAFVYRKPEH